MPCHGLLNHSVPVAFELSVLFRVSVTTIFWLNFGRNWQSHMWTVIWAEHSHHFMTNCNNQGENDRNPRLTIVVIAICFPSLLIWWVACMKLFAFIDQKSAPKEMYIHLKCALILHVLLMQWHCSIVMGCQWLLHQNENTIHTQSADCASSITVYMNIREWMITWRNKMSWHFTTDRPWPLAADTEAEFNLHSTALIMAILKAK